ncbi:MAG: NAD(P)H-dependent glycerol-3-phosphate dehydrogenase [Clostridiales bacterium]|jgi:glycerol-3-phosphate dehydrogenase (NAD(P)+)|nr:NAD(P)H-dependent glycerol-3-phosphate dehydrogenase [Clostridiales bacterium]
MVKKIAVIGAGSWGTALSVLLANKGMTVKLWVHGKHVHHQIAVARENTKYLPGVMIPGNVFPAQALDEVLNDVEATVLAVPSQYIRSLARQISPFIAKDHVIVNVAKGLETGSLYRMSQVIQQEISDARVVVLSGPSHAEEVGRGIPTAVVSASPNKTDSEYVQDIFMSPCFRVYTNPDIIGVEMGGALKNVIALAAGINDGLGYGDNSKAALINRGMVEISRLGKAAGASPSTFWGLSGIGDLIATCTSMHSRNRRAGILIGQGKPLDQVLDSIGMVVEGVNTCKAAYRLSKKHNIVMPVTEQLYYVLFEGKDPREAVEELMLRDRNHELGIVSDDYDLFQ